MINNPSDQDIWGGYLNGDLDDVDSLLITCLNWTSSTQTSTITVTIPTAGSATTGSAKTLYLCNATGGAFAANLPAVATAAGLTVAFKKTDSSANAITITGNSSDKIDGSNTFPLGAQYAYLIIQCDGAKWNIISQTPPAIAAASTSVAGIVQLATAAQIATGTDNTLAATALSLIPPTMSLAVPGYYRFPGGLIIQWGATSVAGNATVVVTLPTAYTTTHFVAVATGNTQTGTAFPATAATTSTTQMTLKSYDAQTYTYNWISLGK